MGELAYELHHPAAGGRRCGARFVERGRPFDLLPHGLDALELLRLEKGHIYLGQDTLPDDTPAKLGMSWAVAMDKPTSSARSRCIGCRRCLRNAGSSALRFDDGADPVAELRGVPLAAGERIVGRVTSAEDSPAVGGGIGLGWIRVDRGRVPDAAAGER